ncbi:MAG: NDP-sugar synthase [Thermoflexaceae bacterium]|nr:NDP-sugar synthase [Thermoflexaceae bacterium]
MDAIVLVGGQGTRLRPLTHTRHKSLVPLCNRPAIAYLLEWLGRSGFQRAILAIGLNNEDLAAAYPGGRVHGIEVVQVLEHQRLESGGAIRNAVSEAGVEGRFAVVNGDVFADFDFADALQAHQAADADLTLALYEVDDPSQFGVAVVDEQRLVTGFVEKPPPGTAPGRLVNAGVWIFEPGLVDEIPPGAVRVEETLFPSLVARRRNVLGYRFAGLWADIGSPARYLALNRELLARGHCQPIAEGVAIDTTAIVAGSSLGAGSRVGAHASVNDSLLWESVSIGEGAVVSGAILADGVQVGESATVTGAVVGSHAVIEPRAIVPPGTSIEPRTRYHAGNGS